MTTESNPKERVTMRGPCGSVVVTRKDVKRMERRGYKVKAKVAPRRATRVAPTNED